MYVLPVPDRNKSTSGSSVVQKPDGNKENTEQEENNPKYPATKPHKTRKLISKLEIVNFDSHLKLYVFSAGENNRVFRGKNRANLRSKPKNP